MASAPLRTRSPRSGAGRNTRLAGYLAATISALLAFNPAAAAPAGSEACRLPGIERAVRCGHIDVAENPDQPGGRQIQVHYAVVPALAKNKAPDPVFVFAGGPGQSALRIAAQVQPVFAQINARRDIVYVDQRGTGRSQPLNCDRPRRVLSLSETLDPVRAIGQLPECLKALDADPAQYATWIAMRDIDAVRAALGARQINLWGGSYGTRAALEYLRQYPDHVRSMVLDGVAPATMALPASFAVDAQAALDSLVANCTRDTDCTRRYPNLAADIDRLLHNAARGVRVSLQHPLTGERESVLLDRTVLAGMLRSPLYAPQLAAMLPHALARAGQGDYGVLLALYAALTSNVQGNFAEVMHFAVVCAEDMPRVTPAAAAEGNGTRFGSGFIEMYAAACRQVPTRPVPAAFYEPARSDVPVLILSGGADPVTPPRHGEAVARHLANARHFVAPNLGHGVSAQGCAPELISRFVRAAGFVDERGRPLEAGCLERLPAPLVFRPISGPVPR